MTAIFDTSESIYFSGRGLAFITETSHTSPTSLANVVTPDYVAKDPWRFLGAVGRLVKFRRDQFEFDSVVGLRPLPFKTIPTASDSGTLSIELSDLPDLGCSKDLRSKYMKLVILSMGFDKKNEMLIVPRIRYLQASITHAGYVDAELRVENASRIRCLIIDD